MHILVVNPNSTEAMTRSIGEAARAVAREGTRITAINPVDAPPAIQGADDGALALPGLMRLFAAEVVERGGYDACIIACFDDTGLMDLKRRSPLPVIGIGEAAFHAATLLGEAFTVVTTLSVSVPVIEANIRAYGFAPRCRSVRASEVPVLNLETDKQASHAVISAEIERALMEDYPDSIVLGCAGMADLAHAMTDRFELPVIDGVAAAVGLAEVVSGLTVTRRQS